MQEPSRLIQELCGRIPGVSSVKAAASIGGGCISQAWRVDVTNHDHQAKSYFVKQNRLDFLANFQAEAHGLQMLADAAVSVDSIVVPMAIMLEAVNDTACLVLPWIDSSPQRASVEGGRPEDPSRRMTQHEYGQTIAQLHRASRGQAIGLPRNNYLGASLQCNEPCDTWTEFVAQHRLGFQLRLAVDSGLASGPMQRDIGRIIDQLDELLRGRRAETVVLHGDLWSGNVLFPPNEKVALIDPAVYRGCAEAEFGMIRLFGGVGADFDTGYQSIHSFPDGWQQRTDIYVLYHLLNHLNLFGASYLSQCEQQATGILSRR